MAAFYCFRIVYYMFFLPPEPGCWEEKNGEAPFSMLAPVGVLSLFTLLLGIFAFLILPLLGSAIEKMLSI
jgi:NADH:ubiquinone oxidoreductase subunit 5 (subunit L)/multisubunit Na+/H+ antiporter MnhA subunit